MVLTEGNYIVWDLIIMKPKILLISDTPNWAFARECDAIEKYLNFKYDIVKSFINKQFKGNRQYSDYNHYSEVNMLEFDLIVIRELFNLSYREYDLFERIKKIDRNKVAITISCNHFYDFDTWSNVYKRFSFVHKYVICISEEVYEKAKYFYKDTDQRLYFAPMGIDTDFFQNNKLVKHQKLVVGWAGNPDHIYGKDHKGFYDVLVPIIRKTSNKYFFRIATNNIGDSNIVAELKRYNNVELLNVTYDDMVEFYNSLDVVLICSQSECVSSVMVEAISCGRPVITSPVGYHKNVIIDGVNGKIINNRSNIEEYINALDIFNGKTSDEYNKIFNLNNFVLENILKWGVVIKRLDQVFERILIDNKTVSEDFSRGEKWDLSDELTVFIVSVGGDSYQKCVDNLKKQNVNFKLDIIKNYAPMSLAFQEMINRCTTKYYVQVDEDMILFQEDSILKMYNGIKNSKTDTAILCYPLWDKHLGKAIYGVKIYKHDIMKKYPYRDIQSCEMDQTSRMNKGGYNIVLTVNDIHLINNHLACLGYHGCYYNEKTAYERYKDLMEKQRRYGWIKFIEEYFSVFYYRFMDNNDVIDLFAFCGLCIGSATDISKPLGEKNFKNYDNLVGFKELYSNKNEIVSLFNNNTVYDFVKNIFVKSGVNYSADDILNIVSKVSSPHEIILYVTGACNSKCWFCKRQIDVNNDLSSCEIMTLNHVKKIFGKFPRVKACGIAGFGEPLLNTELFDIISFLKSKNVFVSLITNGIAIYDNYEKIVTAGLDQIVVSLNAYNKDEHESVTQTKTFDQIMNGIKMLSGKVTKIGLSFVCHNKNYTQIPLYLELANKLNVNFVYFVNLLPHGECQGEDDKEFLSCVIKTSDYDIIKNIEGCKALDTKKIVEHWPVYLSVDSDVHNCKSPFVSAIFAVWGNEPHIGNCRRVMPPSNCYETRIYDKPSPYNVDLLDKLRYNVIVKKIDPPCKYCFGRMSG